MAHNRRSHSTRGEILFQDSWLPHPCTEMLERLLGKAFNFSWGKDELRELVAVLNQQSQTHIPTGCVWQVDVPSSGIVTRVPSEWLDHDISLPYGLKGGGARELFLRSVGYEARAPRDLDLIRKSPASKTEDSRMAQRFMPEDYARGASVEHVKSVSCYMSSRDLTINEVMLFGDQLTVSPFAAVDLLQRTIRPSRYRGGTLSQRPQLSGRVLLKMLRLRAEGLNRGETWRLVGVPSEANFTDSDLAVHLEKALQRGESTAEEFLRHVRSAGYLEEIGTPLLSSVLHELGYLCVGEAALIRSIPAHLRITLAH